jgi:hypothetical protein
VTQERIECHAISLPRDEASRFYCSNTWSLAVAFWVVKSNQSLGAGKGLIQLKPNKRREKEESQSKRRM